MSDENVKMIDTRGLTREDVAIDDPKLVTLAKSSDTSAFEELYRRHRSRVYRSALRILRNSQDAEDIVQRSFQRAFTNLKRFREDSAFSTWVTRIGINESLMLIRQRRVRTHVSETCDSSHSTAVFNLRDSRLTPEQAMAETEMQTAVRDAVYRLRESLRSVVILQIFKGLTSVETAKRLGLSVEAVKGRMFHARLHLRRHLTRKYKLRNRNALGGV